MAKARALMPAVQAAAAAAGQRVVSFDETGAATNMLRRTGWAPRGERLAVPAPAGRWEAVTLAVAVTADGVLAALAYPGATDGPAFRAFVTRVLVPELRPGDLVVLDNLAAHRDREALAAIRAAGAEVRFLPPYSPDFAPVERAFSKVKNHLRKAAARTVEAVYEAAGDALAAVTAEDCSGYFRHCGWHGNG